MRLLDVACGAGGPGLHLARVSGCEVTGVDREKPGLAHGRQIAREAGLATSVRFVQADASQPLPFADGSYEAILCLDALNHLPGRAGVFADWARLLTPGGRMLVTDPVTITGLVAADEIRIRSSIGYFEYSPPGEDERLLKAAGLDVLAVENLTATVAAVARARCSIRAQHARALLAIEGAEAFEHRQRFLDIVAVMAARGPRVALRVPRGEGPRLSRGRAAAPPRGDRGARARRRQPSRSRASRTSSRMPPATRSSARGGAT